MLQHEPPQYGVASAQFSYWVPTASGTGCPCWRRLLRSSGRRRPHTAPRSAGRHWGGSRRRSPYKTPAGRILPAAPDTRSPPPAAEEGELRSASAGLERRDRSDGRVCLSHLAVVAADTVRRALSSRNQLTGGGVAAGVLALLTNQSTAILQQEEQEKHHVCSEKTDSVRAGLHLKLNERRRTADPVSNMSPDRSSPVPYLSTALCGPCL